MFRDQAPFTCDNFIALCTGEIIGNGRFHKKKMHYKGSPFHRILPGFICQGGDYILGNGMGGMFLYLQAYSKRVVIVRDQANPFTEGDFGTKFWTPSS